MPEQQGKEKTTVYKGCAAQVKGLDIEERSVTAVISSNAIDRDNEVLDPKGAKIDRFLSNPVVLWSHDSFSPPVGKAIWVKKGRGKITAKVQFAETERAEEIWQLFKGKFLNAFSVGFDPIAHRQPTPADIKKDPELANVRRIFSEWELLEFSAVAVPANPEALATAVKNHDIELSEPLELEFSVGDMSEKLREVANKIIEKHFDLSPIVDLQPAIKMQEIIVMEPYKEVDMDQVVLEEMKTRKGVMY